MEPPPPSPLDLAGRDLARSLPTIAHALRLYQLLVQALGPLAFEDTAEQGSVRWLCRRVAPGSAELLPWPTAVCSSAGRLGTVVPLSGPVDEASAWRGQGQGQPAPADARPDHGQLVLCDGRQKISLVYGDDGRRKENALDDLFPGRLAEVRAVLQGAADPLAAVAAFVAGLDDARHGPGRLRCPVPVPGGVVGTWATGLAGARRALFDGRVPASARFLVADGWAGTAVCWGSTREEALAAYEAEVRRAPPERHEVFETCVDDYDDDGNLIARGTLPFPLGDAGPTSSDDQGEGAGPEAAPEEGSWKGDAEGAAPEVDPITGRVEFGPMVVRGPRSDAPPPALSPETIPCVLVPLDPSPVKPPPFGRWIRLLGARGATRHVVRAKDGDGFLLVGAEALPRMVLARLRSDLDALDAKAAESEQALPSPVPEFARFVRFRAGRYRWTAATPDRAAGLRRFGGAQGPRFDAGDLDGDELVAEVWRQRRVLRPVD